MDEELLDDLLARVSKFASVLGISRSELKIYSTLLLEGQSSARDLSKKLNISYTKIYSILNRLEDRGWIRKVGRRPVSYEAISLRDLWSNVKKMLEIRVSQLEKEFIEPLSSMIDSASAYTVTVVPPSSLKRTLIDVLNEPSKKYLIAISFPELLDEEIYQLIHSRTFTSEVKVIVQKGIKVPENPSIELKVLDNMFGSGIVTSSSVLLVIKSHESLSSIISSHRYLVDIAQVYFNHLWQQALSIGTNP
ncbi:TrmB family transcriptional regulator [Metallosphaera hakonensis]|uniref:Transcriptional regulator n=1 Tax=Metallosphaera hakonensis JCM 8857 = DSM 7519 TaxID=1293036 RepID=A0A2U9IU78_9CREN|nr:helix-turn-helix domain-containing protein [Metallosphaera hakonensis]AWR99535.1 winged helix-turn-helix transcriptional regulator [Metallosphaera hakonensis JCM 8857 = DSM 7519]